MLLIVLYQRGIWRARPGETITFGRGRECTIRLPPDQGLSRSAGSLTFSSGTWWLRNDSSASLLYLSGDRGFRVDLPPGMRVPVHQWHAKIRLQGMLDQYTLRLRLPELDDVDERGSDAGQSGSDTGQGGATTAGGKTVPPFPPGTGEHLITSTRHRARLTESDRLVLAARFEEYLNWRHIGAPAPRSAKETADRIGWQAHTVAKRCENIRDRYSRLGVPGLRGPRALEELATLLISTAELTSDDLRRLPQARADGAS